MYSISDSGIERVIFDSNLQTSHIKIKTRSLKKSQFFNLIEDCPILVIGDTYQGFESLEDQLLSDFKTRLDESGLEYIYDDDPISERLSEQENEPIVIAFPITIKDEKDLADANARIFLTDRLYTKLVNNAIIAFVADEDLSDDQMNRLIEEFFSLIEVKSKLYNDCTRTFNNLIYGDPDSKLENGDCTSNQ